MVVDPPATCWCFSAFDLVLAVALQVDRVLAAGEAWISSVPPAWPWLNKTHSGRAARSPWPIRCRRRCVLARPAVDLRRAATAVEGIRAHAEHAVERLVASAGMQCLGIAARRERLIAAAAAEQRALPVPANRKLSPPVPPWTRSGPLPSRRCVAARAAERRSQTPPACRRRQLVAAIDEVTGLADRSDRRLTAAGGHRVVTGQLHDGLAAAEQNVVFPPPGLIVSLPEPIASTVSSPLPVLIGPIARVRRRNHDVVVAAAGNHGAGASSREERQIAAGAGKYDSSPSPEPNTTAFGAVSTYAVYPGGRIVRPLGSWTNKPVLPGGKGGGWPVGIRRGQMLPSCTPAVIAAASCARALRWRRCQNSSSRFARARP